MPSRLIFQAPKFKNPIFFVKLIFRILIFMGINQSRGMGMAIKHNTQHTHKFYTQNDFAELYFSKTRLHKTHSCKTHFTRNNSRHIILNISLDFFNTQNTLNTHLSLRHIYKKYILENNIFKLYIYIFKPYQ
jgi:hypothetical protein